MLMPAEKTERQILQMEKTEKELKGRSLKVIMLTMLIPLILIGQIASSIGAIKNIKDYGDSVVSTDLNNGYIAALQSLDSYFWGIEYRMTTMSMTNLIQKETVSGQFDGTNGLLMGLKGANDVITGTVYRSEKGDNLIIPSSVNYKAKGMTSVIEDEYYEQAKANDFIWVGPYEDKLTGEKTLSVYRSVKDSNDKVIGVIGMNINFHDISQYFCEREFSTTGYDIMLGKDGTILSDKKDMSRVHTKTDNPVLLEIAAQSGETEGSLEMDGGTYRYKACDIPRTNWRMISLISADEHDDVTARSVQVQLMITVLVILASIVAVWFIIGGITKRLQKLKAAMNSAGSGNLTGSVKLKSRNVKRMDEMDVIGDSYNKMIRDFSVALGDTKETLAQLLERNKVLDESFEKLSGSSGDISNTMQEVSQVSEEQARSTTTVVGETTELSENIEAVSSLVITMKDSCTELKDKTSFGLEIVNNLVASSEDTMRATEEITSSINNVDSSSKEIEDIIGLINSIADQTNLLALNASIEAARAGEAGRGFAVVADEIRNLAEQSQGATANIRNIIMAMQNKITDTVKAVADVNTVMAAQSQSVKETEESFNNISHNVDSLGTLLTEVEDKNATMVQKKEGIFSSMTELSAGIEETSASTLEVTNSAQRQAEIVKQLTILTEEIAEYSNKLNEKLSHFICE